MMISFQATSIIAASLFSVASAADKDPTHPALNCYPCIARSNYKIKAIYHGDKDDPFWQPVQKAALQAGQDLGVALDIMLYDSFDPAAMAADVEKAVEDKPDALIVTIPDRSVEEAVRHAIASGIPVFGVNSGYQAGDHLGVKAYVAQDEYLAGQMAAREMLRISHNNISQALFVNHEVGNIGLHDRRAGFEITLQSQHDSHSESNHPIVDELQLGPVWTDAEIIAELSRVMVGCPYDVVQMGALRVNEIDDVEAVLASCPNTKVGTFDVSEKVYKDIADGRLAFGISQQEYLQGVMPVHLAVTYVTTGKLPSPPIVAGGRHEIYLSGPSLVTRSNLPSGALQTFAEEGFPTCSSPDAAAANNGPCFDRSKVRIGGVVHGVTTDSFWDQVFAAAKLAANDMNVQLLMDRIKPPAPGQSDRIITDQMVTQIKQLCQQEPRVDGLFVSIPNGEARLLDAIGVCQEAHIPVVSINSGEQHSRALQLMHHVGQREYEAGIAAAQRLVESGQVNKAYCINHEPENMGIAHRCLGFATGLRRSAVQYGGEVVVPRDDHEMYVAAVEAAVKDATGSWEGVGLLLAGQDHIASALHLLEFHPDVTMGTFDVSDEIFVALDLGQLKFGMDQQAYLQGYMPIPLLTYFVQSEQRLENEFLESGPSFITSSPSSEAVICETNKLQVCSEPTNNTPAHIKTQDEVEQKPQSTSDTKVSQGAALAIVLALVVGSAMVSVGASRCSCSRKEAAGVDWDKEADTDGYDADPTETEGTFAFA